MSLPFTQNLQRLQICIRHHEPLRAGVLEVDLHAGVAALAFVVEHDAFAEFRVLYALAELETLRHVGDEGFLEWRFSNLCGTHDGVARAHLFDEFLGDLADEARWSLIHLAAVEAPVLGVGDVELALGARDADVT